MKIGMIGVLGICFVVLKLTGIIDWSWFYVTAPFWGGIAIIGSVVLLGILGVGGAVGVAGIKSLVRKKR